MKKESAFLADVLAKKMINEWMGRSDLVITVRRQRGGRPPSDVGREVKIAKFIEMEQRKIGMKNALYKAEKKFGLKESRLRDFWNAHKSLFDDVQ